ncbi:hypothetical protein DFQ30_002622 [Apophysomyces sp. BC1015]|nr:hypothetical protein DFQ30_002622 [Apophysomyces sp. BC1015]
MGNLDGFEYMEYPGCDACCRLRVQNKHWTCSCDPEATQAITERLVSRLHPAVTAIKKIVARGKPDGRQDVVDDTEARLVLYDYCGQLRSLYNEIFRLENKYCANLSIFKEHQTVEEVLVLLPFQQYMFGADKLVLQEVVLELMKRTFSRIKIVDGAARTFIDEPFVLKAAENYFKLRDSGVRCWFVK